MKKFTRRHYNKKLIALGLSAFMGIGLTSTGFAAWVMSQNAKEEVSGNVNVSTMTDASVKIMIYQSDDLGVAWSKSGAATHCGINSGFISEDEPCTPKTLTEDGYSRTELGKNGDKYTLTDSFVFDAEPNDKSGRLRNDSTPIGEDPLYGADLEIQVFGTLIVDDIEYELTPTVTLPQSIENAIAKNYLEFNPETDVKTEWSTVEGYENDFVVTVTLKWGSVFGGMNPSLYYDEHETGKEVPDDDMKDQMVKFWNIIAGRDENAEYDWETQENLTFEGAFTITLGASPKEV